MSHLETLESHTSLAPVLLGMPLRAQFPIFRQNTPFVTVRPTHLAYLDTAASAQKPDVVIKRLAQYLGHEHANIHRGAYELSARATEMYDHARALISRFINSPSADQIVFTRGATEGFNLVARGLERFFKAGDVILLTLLEHHSNIVPWQMLATRTGAKVVFADIAESGQLDRADFLFKLQTLKPKFVSFTAHSNALGTILPVTELVAEAHAAGAWVMVDAAQAIVHGGVDVTDWDADFVAASAHKIYGPTGIGFLYGRAELLAEMEPMLGGGDMIERVTVEGSTWAGVPRKFEAGTPAIAEAIAFGTAVEFVQSLGHKAITEHESSLFEIGFALLQKEPGVTVYGPATEGGEQGAILSFNIEGVHPHDFASIADGVNVQVRAGHHCTQPLWQRLGLQSTIRASLGVYSCPEDFEALLEAIRHARKIFK